MSRRCPFLVGLVVVVLAATPPAAALDRPSISVPHALSEVRIPAFLARLWTAFGMGWHKNGISADPNGHKNGISLDPNGQSSGDPPGAVSVPNGETGCAAGPNEVCGSGS